MEHVSSEVGPELRRADVAPVKPLDGRWRTRIALYLVSRKSEAMLAIAICVDFLTLAASMVLSIVLARGVDDFSMQEAVTTIVAPFLTVSCLLFFGAYRVVVRFIGMEFIERS